jgi:hypothetical protein
MELEPFTRVEVATAPSPSDSQEGSVFTRKRAHICAVQQFNPAGIIEPAAAAASRPIRNPRRRPTMKATNAEEMSGLIDAAYADIKAHVENG